MPIVSNRPTRFGVTAGPLRLTPILNAFARRLASYRDKRQRQSDVPPAERAIAAWRRHSVDRIIAMRENRTSNSAQRFVQSVHRRMIAVRLVERGVVATALGAGAACIFEAMAARHGRASVEGAVALVAFSLMGAIAISLRRMPTFQAAAREADRQLKLDDLLATALRPGENDADEFFGAVVAMANARCAAISRRGVRLRRLGWRMWTTAGGCILACAVVTGYGSQQRPAAAVGVSESTDDWPRIVDGVAQFDMPAPDVAAGHRDEASEEGASHFNTSRNGRPAAEADDGAPDTTFSDTAADLPGAADSAKAPGAPGNASGGGDPNSHSGNGTGGSSAKNVELAKIQQESATPDVPGKGGDENAKSGGGGGREAIGDGARTAAGDATSKGAGRSAAAPPWQAADWSRQRAAAGLAVEIGDVPGEYRDIVRAYFDRDSGR